MPAESPEQGDVFAVSKVCGASSSNSARVTSDVSLVVSKYRGSSLSRRFKKAQESCTSARAVFAGIVNQESETHVVAMAGVEGQC